MLRFDSKSCSDGLYKAIQKTADLLIEEYEAEIKQGMNTTKGAENVNIGLSNDDRKRLHREVVGGALAIMDSYGRGSLMDKSNPFLADYMSSELFNPLRQGYAIVGREAGDYTNIFGEQAQSSGAFAGSDIERVVRPIAPSKAFQQALIWFKAGNRIDKRLQECIRSFDYSKYFVYR